MAETAPVKKVSTSETGHNKNAANMGILGNTIEGFGASYNPANPDITLAKIRALKTNMEQALARVQAAEAPYKNAVNKRMEGFDNMGVMATRVQSAAQALCTSSEIADIKAMVKRIHGSRKMKSEDPAVASKAHSTSQMSFDSRTASFRELVAFLSGLPAYKPNESALQVATLTTYLNGLSALSDTVSKSAVALSNARAERDRLFYAKDAGAIALGLKAKAYVKSAYGPKSAQYKSVAKIDLKMQVKK